MRRPSIAETLSLYLHRAKVVHGEFGFRELIGRVLRRLGFQDRAIAAWRKQKMEADVNFDQHFGTDTGGVQNLADQGGIVGENAKHGLAHIATEPAQFSQIMQMLDLPLSEFTFVDLGCGKGRALILAAQFPFKTIIGVDFVLSFVEAARKNISVAAA